MDTFIIISFAVLFMGMIGTFLLIIGVGVQLSDITKNNHLKLSLLYQILGLSNQGRIKQEEITVELSNIIRGLFFQPPMMDNAFDEDLDDREFLLNDQRDIPFSFGAVKDNQSQSKPPIDKTTPPVLSLSDEELQQLLQLFETEISKLEKPDAQE